MAAAPRRAPLAALPVIDASELKTIRVLAAGGQKRVTLCRVFDPETCGLDASSTARLRDDFATECALLHVLGAHTNVMRIFGRVEGQLAFVAELCEGGSVARQLRAEPPTMNLAACVRVAKSVARAMRFLHSLPAPVVHGDLTAGNVLLTANGVAKLCDFGLSRTQHQTKGLTKAAGGDRGTIYAMAPEQLDSEQQHVTFKADVWSFGCLLIELFHPQHTQPYSKFKTQAIAFQICSGKQPPELSDVQPAALGLFIARKLLVEPPHARADFAEIVRTLDSLFPSKEYPLPVGVVEDDATTIDDLRARERPLPGTAASARPKAAPAPAAAAAANNSAQAADAALAKVLAREQQQAPPRMAPVAAKAAPVQPPPRVPAVIVAPKPRPVSARPQAAVGVGARKPLAAAAGPVAEPPAYLRMTASRAAGSAAGAEQSVDERLLSMRGSGPKLSVGGVASMSGGTAAMGAGVSAGGGGKKTPHPGFWRFPPVGQIKGEWSCCGSSRYHDAFCV